MKGKGRKRYLYFLFWALLILACHFLPGTSFPHSTLEAAKRLIESGRLDQAVRLLKGASREEPPDLSALLLLGKAYRLKGECKKALKAYKRVLHTSPRNSEAMMGAGICYSNLDQPFKAIGIFERLVESEPENGMAHYLLGIAQERVRNINKAWEQYEILKKLDKRLADKLYKVIFW